MLFPLYLSLFLNIHKNKLRYKLKRQPLPDNSNVPLLIDYNKENLKYGYKPFFNRYTPISPYKKYIQRT